jgi:photosystem II stability/assembly factor-like uncharacterized protein
MATTFTAFSKKAIFVLLFLIINICTNFAQKGPSKPTNPKNPISSALNCPLVLSIQDNNPTAECSELLKTLVAITSPCTDTTAVSYEWSSSIGGVFSTSRTTTFNLPEFIVATPLTINVMVTEGIDTQSASYTFTIKPRPSRPTISPVGALILCDSNPITLTSTGCVGGSTPVWSNGNAGLNSISVPAIGGTFYKVACEKNGCVSDSTAAVSLVTGIVTPAPVVTNRVICEVTTITPGNGLLADIPNCGTGATGTFTYSGPLVGYDDGYTSSGGVDPTVAIPTSPNIIKKLSVSITWRKQKGGFQNSCGVGDTESNPYHSETQFRLKSPSGKIITLVNTYTYGGYLNPTVTTVFEDGATPVNFYSPPVSGTFAPAQPLSAYIGENPTGTWTLLPYDDVWKDPLCVSGFSITFTADQGGEVTWWDAPTGGNLLHTGAEYIPSATAAGIHTYYAQGQCVKGCPSSRTATILTINPRPAAPAIDVNVPEISGTRFICGGQPITLTATGCANDAIIKWSGSQNGANFATGSSYTFTPIFSNSSDINQTFTAVCTGTNLCNSLFSNTITLNVKRKPATPTISGPGSTACINSNITLFASACSGGTLGWTGNRSGSSITFPITTNVDIKVACTINGCTSDSSSVYSISTLPKPPVPTVNASQVQAICIGGSVTLTANGCINGGTVKWTGGLTGASIVLTPTTSKSYRASCLGTNGCASDSSAVLNIVVLPKTKPIITGPTFVCNDSPITLTASGCTGVNETVMWRDQSVGLTYSDFITQTKTFRAVCIRNGYCVSDSSDVFTVEYRTKPLQPTITAPPNTTVCQGTSLTLTASACVGGISNWTGGLIGNSIAISAVGTRQFKVACIVNGCTSDSSVAISVTVKPKPGIPTISSSGNIVCEGQNVTLSASACVDGSLSWTGGLTGQSIIISNVGLRSYKVACTINGCTSDSSLVNAVQIKPKPATPTITANPSTTVCQGSTVTLTASACLGGTLNWTGGLAGNSIFITNVGSKNYRVACTVNGCTSDSSAAVLVTVKPKPGIPTISSSGNIVCEGQNVTLTASACVDGSLSWTGGLTGQSIIISNVGLRSYKVACTINGCTSDSSLVNAVQIKPKPATPTITANPSTTVCQGSTVTLTASACPGGTLNWTGGLAGNSIFITNVGSKNYRVACTVNGCTSDSSAAVLVTVNPVPIISLTTNKSEICAGENATLTVSGCTGIISWSNGAGNVASINVSPIITTNYIATCTLGTCTSTQQTTITPLQTPRVTASGPLVCDQSITLTAENYPAGSTIQWRKDGVDISGATNTTLVVNEPGNYDFVVGNLESTQLQLEVVTGVTGFNFVNSKFGYLFNGSVFKRTTDGGNTWSDSNLNFLIQSVFFQNSTHGWAVGYQNILRTTDGGITWLNSNTNLFLKQFIKVAFKDNLNGVAITDANIPYFTNDGGINWSTNGIPIANRNNFYEIRKIEYIPSTNSIIAIAVDFIGTGNVFKSVDGGTNWTQSGNYAPLLDFTFNDSNNGWASTIDAIYKTTNGGNSWTKIDVGLPGSNGHIYSIKFINNQIGLLFGYYSILKTIDGGLTWANLKNLGNDAINSYYDLHQLDFIDVNTYWYSYVSQITTPDKILLKRNWPASKCPTIPAIVAPPTNQATAISLSANRLEICDGESSTITSSACNGTLSWSNGAGNVSSITVSPTITTTYIATCTSVTCTKTAQITITPLQTPRVTASGPLVCDQSITLTAENYPVGATLQWRKDGVDIVGATGTTLVVNEAGNYDFVVGNTSSLNLNIPYSNENSSNIKFLNASFGFIFDGTRIKITNNAGNSWTTFNTDFNITDVDFIDSQNGWIVGRSKILKTIDGGINWTNYTGNEIQFHDFVKVSFKNLNVGVAISSYANYYRTFFTINGGLTWSLNNNPLGTPDDFFVPREFKWVPNSDRIVCIGNSINTTFGIVRNSESNFQSWTSSNLDRGIYSIQMLDQYNGVIGTSEGVYKTVNGGNTWNFQSASLSEMFYDVDFINLQTGYGFGMFKIYKTKNAGATWTEIYNITNTAPSYRVNFNKIDFISEQLGWYSYLANNGEILLTKVSGLKCPTSPAIVALPVNVVSAISLSSDKTEICAGESATITSTACNGTLSWSNSAGNVNSITVAPTITTTYTVTCTSGTCTKTAQITITPVQTPRVVASGPLVCGQSVTLTAENFNQFVDGIQWRKNGVDIIGATNISISVSEPGNYDFVVGKLVTTSLSIDYGVGTSKVLFINPNVGFFYSGTNIKKTVDGGNTWNNFDSGVLLQDMFFTDINHGWAVGYGSILRTINGGTTWNLYSENIGATQFFKVIFKNNLEGIATSEQNTIYLTTDGGNSWTTNNIPIATRQSYSSISDIKYIPNSTTIICTVNNYSGIGKIFTSNNGGISWVINPINYQPLYALNFTDGTNGLIGTFGGVYKTIDGGINWNLKTVTPPIQEAIISLDFVNIQVGYAFQEIRSNFNGKIYKTTNGGNDWYLYRSVFEEDGNLVAFGTILDFVSEDNGWYLYQANTNNGSKTILKKISTPQCPTTPAIVSPIPRPGGALVINTFKSGAWTDASTWSCGFIPSLLDEVIINTGHTITDNGNLIQAKKVTFNGNGTLQIAPTTTLKLGN